MGNGTHRGRFLGLAVGLIVLFFGGLVLLHFWRDPCKKIELHAKRTELVQRMRRGLALASEAEKRAVLATVDKDAQTFADEARAASTAVEQERMELDPLLQSGESQSNERDLLAQFSKAFFEYQNVDNEVLSLAVKNSNLKAANLAQGPAAEALKEMEAALSHLMAESATTTSAEAKKVMLLAFQVQAAAFRIQLLLPPHIAESSDQKKTELEALMTKEDQEVTKGLEALASLVPERGKSDVETAHTHYGHFSDLRAQLLALSRENADVRSLSLSLNQKRKATMKCEEILAGLDKAMQSSAQRER